MENNSLSHWTPTFENILGILQNGLRFGSGKENLPFDSSTFSVPNVSNSIRKQDIYASVISHLKILMNILQIMVSMR